MGSIEWDIDANMPMHRRALDLTTMRVICTCGDWNCASLDAPVNRQYDTVLVVQDGEDYRYVTGRLKDDLKFDIGVTNNYEMDVVRRLEGRRIGQALISGKVLEKGLNIEIIAILERSFVRLNIPLTEGFRII